MASAASGPLASTELQKGEYVHVSLPPPTFNSQSQTRSKWKYIHIFIFEKHRFSVRIQSSFNDSINSDGHFLFRET